MELLLLLPWLLGGLAFSMFPDQNSGENVRPAETGTDDDDTITVGVDSIFLGSDDNDSLVGTDGRDEMFGGPGNDTIAGGVGDDYIDGGEGGDHLRGGTGNDTIFGRAGNDRIFGGAGDDSINAGFGADTVWGGPGNDEIFGGAGNDLLFGGPGDDTITGGLGNDTLEGGEGDDSLVGFAGQNILNGGDGNDTLDAVARPLFSNPGEPSLLDGGNGNDLLFGDDGDTLTGGAGDDHFIVVSNGSTDPVTITDYEPGGDILEIQAYLPQSIIDLGPSFLTRMQGTDSVDILLNLPDGSSSIVATLGGLTLDAQVDMTLAVFPA